MVAANAPTWLATAASLVLAAAIVKHGGEAAARNEQRLRTMPAGPVAALGRMNIHPVGRGMG